LAGLPFVLALGEPIEVARDWLTLGFALIPAVLATHSANAFLGEGAAPRARPFGQLLSPAVVAIATVGWAVATARVGIRHHPGFGTSLPDVGRSLDVVANSSAGRLLACSVCERGHPAHFEPIFVVIAPLFRLGRSAETLIVVQTIALALGAP